MELHPFIVKAKINTYAGRMDVFERQLEDGGKEYTYQESNFRYRDRHFGFNPFAGEEVIWQGDSVVWMMSYYGRVIGSSVPASQVYQFLKKALNMIRTDRPFRGPAYMKEIDFEYFDESQGDVDCFVGTERIFFRGEEVYRLDYIGGRIES